MINGEVKTFEEFLLRKAIEDNPFFLLEIDCDQIRHWQSLAQHRPSQNVKDKINNLPSTLFNSFAIQTLNGAKGTIVNLDYFAVNITMLPNNPNTNQPFTAEEFLDYFRRNLNDFVEGATFQPYCKIPDICEREKELWNADDPTGALIYIDIPLDDGVVVCSKYQRDYWYFMTMNAPVAGNHPVSGTRQFGYEQNSDGSYNFFVRGVDRFDSNIVENVLYMIFDGRPFVKSDDLWESFQHKLNQFVNNSNGSSTKWTPVKNRPDWKKVKDVLEGLRPVSDLGCK